MRELLEALGAGPELAALAWLAGREVQIDEEELQGARRRAVLLLAAGGDPQRGLELDGRAVTALAADLDSPERRDELAAGLRGLQDQAADLDSVSAALASLLLDTDLAWRALACGLLAEELA